jgi:hypothetical protein
LKCFWHHYIFSLNEKTPPPLLVPAPRYIICHIPIHLDVSCYNLLRFSKTMEDVHFSCKMYTIFTIFYGAYCRLASGFCGVYTFRKTRVVLSSMRSLTTTTMVMMMTRPEYVNPETAKVAKHLDIPYQKYCQFSKHCTIYETHVQNAHEEYFLHIDATSLSYMYVSSTTYPYLLHIV